MFERKAALNKPYLFIHFALVNTEFNLMIERIYNSSMNLT